MTSIISDLPHAKGGAEAGVRQRLAGRWASLPVRDRVWQDHEYKVREDQRTEDTWSKLPINSEFWHLGSGWRLEMENVTVGHVRGTCRSTGGAGWGKVIWVSSTDGLCPWVSAGSCTWESLLGWAGRTSGKGGCLRYIGRAVGWLLPVHYFSSNTYLHFVRIQKAGIREFNMVKFI